MASAEKSDGSSGKVKVDADEDEECRQAAMEREKREQREKLSRWKVTTPSSSSSSSSPSSSSSSAAVAAAFLLQATSHNTSHHSTLFSNVIIIIIIITVFHHFVHLNPHTVKCNIPPFEAGLSLGILVLPCQFKPVYQLPVMARHSTAILLVQAGLPVLARPSTAILPVQAGLPVTSYRSAF